MFGASITKPSQKKRCVKLQLYPSALRKAEHMINTNELPKMPLMANYMNFVVVLQI
jgi:hypothetical protein